MNHGKSRCFPAIAIIFASMFLLLPGLDAQTTIKMKRDGGVFTIPCKVNGLALDFMLDTGASDVSISLTEALFMLRHGYLSEKDFVGVEKYSLADGTALEGDSVIFRKM